MSSRLPSDARATVLVAALALSAFAVAADAPRLLRDAPEADAPRPLRDAPAGDAARPLRDAPAGDAARPLRDVPAGDAARPLRDVPAAEAARALRDVPAGAARPPAAASAPAGGGYVLRCWQYGRLLFEEHDVGLPAEFHASMKLRGNDAGRRPLYVSDTGSAVCLVRSAGTRR